jgi:hypothetical protein
MRVFVLLCCCFLSLGICRADELAAVTGLLTDPHGRSVPDVKITITNLGTNVDSQTTTNGQGIYRLPSLQPGIYRITVLKDGFKSIVKSGVELHVQDIASINFELQIGSVTETVTVEAGGLVVNTTDASVSTVVDHQFVENMPLNGRSFQSLLLLTPGAVVSRAGYSNPGQFSVNGQRTDANYFTIDGASANIGISGGNGLYQSAGGAIPGFSAQGGTNSLVSIDAMQEFRVQTSSFAPEFGRTPGAQISVVTRSGTNSFHGTAFEYLRNDLFDANDWFANYNRLAKPEERQNDFGGVFGGPIVKDRTFFFFSYEGLRLRQPKVAETVVPDVASRSQAPAGVQPFLNAFPLPNGAELNGHFAQFNSSYSDPSTLNAYSLRMDQQIKSRFRFFGRWAYSPSSSEQRNFSHQDLSNTSNLSVTNHTLTIGLDGMLSATASNDLRLNYSNVRAGTVYDLDNFGGAVPLSDS